MRWYSTSVFLAILLIASWSCGPELGTGVDLGPGAALEEDAGLGSMRDPCSTAGLLFQLLEEEELSAADRGNYAQQLGELESQHSVDGLHCWLRDKVRRLQQDAAMGQEVRKITLEVNDTAGWGCPCPPYVLARAGREVHYLEEFLYPMFTEGIKDISDGSVPGRFRLTGSYSGREENFYNWQTMRERKAPPRGQGDRHKFWAQRYPLFIVESWCAVPLDDPEFPGIREEGLAVEDYCK